MKRIELELSDRELDTLRRALLIYSSQRLLESLDEDAEPTRRRGAKVLHDDVQRIANLLEEQ